MGARQELRALGAEEIEHGLRRRQQDLVLARISTNHCRMTGNPVDIERHQPPLVEFMATVCAEMKAMPSPAMTACLMVSLLSISMPIFGESGRLFWKNCSISTRVPEPGLARHEAFRRRDRPPRSAAFRGRRCAVGAMMTCGCSPISCTSCGCRPAGGP